LSKIIPAYFLIFVLVSGTMSPVFSNAFAEEVKIPSWLKFNADLWVDGKQTDAEFFRVIEWLIENRIIVIDLKDIEPKQKTITSVDDDDFVSVAKKGIQGWIDKISKSPADPFIRAGLPLIPIVGTSLGILYDQATGTPKENNDMILKVLENMKKMENEDFKKTSSKLDENLQAIKNNEYKLDDLLTETKQILVITTDTNVRVISLEAKLDQVLLQLKDIKIGKNIAEIPSELKTQLNEITQLKSELQDSDLEGINVDPARLEALAKTEVLQGNFDSAIKIYDKILEQDSKNYNALNEKAWTLYELGKVSESNTAFGEFLKHYPADSEGWEGKGWNLLELRMFDEAKDSFNESFRLDNSNAYAIAGLGWVSLEEGNCQMAESIFYDALEIDQGNEDAIQGLELFEDYDC